MTSTDTTTQAPAPVPSLTAPAAAEPAPSLTAPASAAEPAPSLTAPAAPAPITYEAFKFPEGVEVEKEGLDQATALFAKSGLKQEQAQELIDFYVKTAQDTAKAAEEAAAKAWTETRQKWTDEVKADPQIGGDKLPQTVAAIAKVLDKYGAPGIREQLSVTGADNNPAVIKTLWNIAQAMTEGMHVAGEPSGKAPPQSLAERMYPDGPKMGLKGQ